MDSVDSIVNKPVAYLHYRASVQADRKEHGQAGPTQDKQLKARKKDRQGTQSAGLKVKELRLTTYIEEHDYDSKRRQAEKLLLCTYFSLIAGMWVKEIASFSHIQESETILVMVK